MIQSYEDGGLKAPDIHSMYSSLKYSWIKRLIANDARWAHLSHSKLNEIGGLTYVLQSNFKPKYSPVPLGDFLESVLEANNKINDKKSTTKPQILNEIINLNQNITCNGKSLFIPQLIEAKMDRIKHWFTATGEPKSCHMIRIIHGVKITTMQYNQIISAIPKEWKKILKHSNGNSQAPNNTEPVPYKKAKQKLIQKQQLEPSGIRRWEKRIKEPIDEKYWTNVLFLARKTSKVSKYQVFQYKIIHRILATKQTLHRAKHRDSPNCADCENRKETIEHMLLDCPTVKEFWSKVAHRFNEIEETSVPDDNETLLLFGLKSSENHIRKWNFLTLCARFFIYKSRLTEKPIKYEIFQKVFNSNLEILKHCENTKRKKEEFMEYWAGWLTM